MANMCSTSYAVYCENTALMQKICNAINECASMTEPLIPGSDSNWVGNVFKKLGLNKCNERTFWSDAKIEDGVLKFYESSAWSRGRAIILLQDHFDNGEDEENFISIYFVSEELGNGIYETNDEAGLYFKERYCLYGDNGDEYYDTFDDLKKDVQEMLGTDTDFRTVAEINAALAESDDDDCGGHVYEIEFTDLE